MRKALVRRIWLIGAIAVLILSAAGVQWYWFLLPRKHMDRLVAGDHGVAIRHLVIQGHRGVVEVADPQSLSYLTSAMRTARTDDHRLGITYTAVISFGATPEIAIGLYVPEDVDGVTISYPIDSLGDPQYYWVPLPEPMPDSIRSLLEGLRHPEAQSTTRPSAE